MLMPLATQRTRIAGAAENGVDDEDEHDDHVPAQHPGGIAGAMLDAPGIGAHEREDVFGEKDAGDHEGKRCGHGHGNCLHGRVGRLVRIFFADSSGYKCGRGHRKPDADRIHQRHD
jgi:hypothetical protein